MKRYRVIFARKTLRDFKRLTKFFMAKDIGLAAQVEPTLRAAVKLLSKLPLMGRIASGQADVTLRELVVPFGSTGYVVLYRVRTGEVRILAVRHQLEGRYN